MRLFNACLLAISALGYATAFLWPSVCCWLVFIFLIPIFYGGQRQLLSFWSGLWWGTIFFSVHFYGLIMVLWERAEGDFRLLAGLGLIIYCAFYAGIWFYLASKIAGKFDSIFYKTGVWALTTLGYFWWIAHGSFWIFGSWLGYPFSSVLIPLAHYPLSLSLLPVTGEQFLLCMIILCQAFLACTASNMHWFSGSWPVFLMPFLIGFMSNQSLQAPHWLEHVCYAAPPRMWDSQQEQAEAINLNMTLALHKKPMGKIVVMPESTCLFPLNTRQEIIELWAKNALENNITLFIGAPRADKQRLYNSIYLLGRSRITKNYDKNTYVPFSEYTPYPWNKFNYFKSLFLGGKKDFSQKETSCVAFKVTPTLTLLPQICSDLFLGPGPKTNLHPGSPILFIVNDAWFSTGYYRNLMFLFTVVKAISLQRDIIYVGHTKAAWISKKNGQSISL